MKEHEKSSLISAVALFILGHVITYVGLLKGREIAIVLSRPAGATGWTTDHEQVIGTMILLTVIGVSLVVLGVIGLTIIFKKWYNTL